MLDWLWRMFRREPNAADQMASEATQRQRTRTLGLLDRAHLARPDDEVIARGRDRILEDWRRVEAGGRNG